MKETSEGDSSQTKLPQDMDLWAEEITTKIRERIPMSRHMLIKISFINRNEELGIATGAATLHDQKLNKAVYLPLIVKNFSLSPLDVMLVPSKGAESGFDVSPFHQDLFADVMFNSEVFDHLERPIDRIQQMYMNPQNSVVFPPNHRNVYASAGGGIIDTISDTISPADKKAFLNNLRNDQNAMVGYEKRANLDILKKIATSKIKITPESAKTLANVTLLKQKGDKVSVLTTSDEVFSPIIASGNNRLTPCDENGEDIVLPEETLNEVKMNGEKMVFRELTPKNDVMVGPTNSPQHYTKTDEQPVEAQIFGAYKVQDKNGVFHKGIILPNLIDFNMKRVNGKVFKSLNKSSFQDKIVGIPTGAEKTQFLKFREPEIGMTGVFVTYNDTNALATIPFTIRSITDVQGNDHIIAVGLKGEKIKIKYGGYIPEDNKPDFEEDVSLKNIAKVKDYYIVPRRFKFLAMDNFCELMENGSSMTLKTASKSMSYSPVRVIYTGDSQFSLKGPDMTKMARMCGWDSTNLGASQAAFLLTSKNCPLTKVAEALKTAGAQTREVYIHGLPSTNYEYKQDEQEVKVASAVLEQINLLRTDLTKEAAGIEDSQVVDAALSLNFINSENIDKFVSFIPVFEQCSKLLSQVLLASRLGIEEIPEQASAVAMHKLIEVVQGLNKLKSLEEKTASRGKGYLTSAQSLLSKHAGEISVGSGLNEEHLGSGIMGLHMSKAAGFFNFDEKKIKIKGKKKKLSAKDLTAKAYKKAHGKKYEE